MTPPTVSNDEHAERGVPEEPRDRIERTDYTERFNKYITISNRDSSCMVISDFFFSRGVALKNASKI